MTPPRHLLPPRPHQRGLAPAATRRVVVATFAAAGLMFGGLGLAGSAQAAGDPVAGAVTGLLSAVPTGSPDVPSPAVPTGAIGGGSTTGAVGGGSTTDPAPSLPASPPASPPAAVTCLTGLIAAGKPDEAAFTKCLGDLMSSGAGGGSTAPSSGGSTTSSSGPDHGAAPVQPQAVPTASPAAVAAATKPATRAVLASTGAVLVLPLLAIAALLVAFGLFLVARAGSGVNPKRAD